MKVPKAFVVQKMCLSSADEYSTFKSHGHVTLVDIFGWRDSNDKSSRIFIQINNKLSSNWKKKRLNRRDTLIFKTGMSVRAGDGFDQPAIGRSRGPSASWDSWMWNRRQEVGNRADLSWVQRVQTHAPTSRLEEEVGQRLNATLECLKCFTVDAVIPDPTGPSQDTKVFILRRLTRKMTNTVTQ